MLKTYAFINLQNLQGFTINDGMFSYYHHYQINVLVVYKCNYLMQQTKSLQQRLKLYSHEYPIISFTSSNPIIICMGTHVQFKKLITRAKVCTPMQNIHKLKLIDNITRSARFGKTCWSKVF